MMYRKITFIVLMVLSITPSIAQEGRKVWLSGSSRGIIYADKFETGGDVRDTTTARKTQSGYALVDLGIHVQPVKNVEIQGMLRIRNDLGGFWGSGVTLDLRQLSVKGVIADIIRFQLGDIDYKLSPYTFQNSEEWVLQNTGPLTTVPLDFIRYDVFQNDDLTWRQQGLATDFGFQFKKIIKEANFSLFVNRVQAGFDNGGNDRMIGGGMMEIIPMENLRARFHYVNLFDIAETSSNPVALNNPVQTLAVLYDKQFGAWSGHAEFEGGRSKMEWLGDDEAPVLEDGFFDAQVSAKHASSGIKMSVSWREVGSNFRSPGAQSKRIRFNSSVQAYQRYGNEQALRQISTYDLVRDASLYNTQIQAGLMAFDPRYGNATPYGRATPNRRGVTTGIEWREKADKVGLNIGFDRLSDIVGQGTDEKRNFTLLSVGGDIRIDKYLNLKQKLNLTATWQSENTERDGSEFDAVDLSNSIIQAGLEWEFIPKLSLLGELRQWTSDGTDLLATRDDFSQITDYNTFVTKTNETFWGSGLQYTFSEKIKAQVFYQQFSWEDEISGQLPYKWENWQINLYMAF